MGSAPRHGEERRLSWAEALMRSPEALSFSLEAWGKVVLECAGVILEERVASMPG